jgi:alkaline phosphatase
LNYANGRGYTGATDTTAEGPKFFGQSSRRIVGIKNGRPDLTKIDTTDPNYEQEALIPLSDNTHGGEDVAIFAEGVDAHLIRGSMEENWIFFVMADALRLGRTVSESLPIPDASITIPRKSNFAASYDGGHSQNSRITRVL